MPAFEKTDAKDSSLFSIAFFAILMALIGALFGFIALALISPKPFGSVVEFESQFEEDARPTLLSAHYFEGSESKLNDWAQKRESLLTGDDGTIELTDSEINAWIVDKFEKPKALYLKEEEPKSYIVPGPLNVFIHADEGIYFSVPLEIVFSEKRIECLLTGQGHFAGKDPVEFRLTKLKLNEALIPFSERQNRRLLDPLLKSLYESDEFIELKGAWEKVENVELIETGVRLNLNG